MLTSPFFQTDEKIFDSVKRHLLVNPFDRVAVIVLTVNADYRDQQQRQQQTWMTIIDRRLNTPVYYYFAQSGVWSNFYSSANLNTVAVSPSEVVQLYNNEAPLLRQGTFGVALLDIIHGIRDKALMKQQTWMNTDRTTLAQVRLPFNRQQPSTSLDLDVSRLFCCCFCRITLGF